MGQVGEEEFLVGSTLSAGTVDQWIQPDEVKERWVVCSMHREVAVSIALRSADMEMKRHWTETFLSAHKT